MAQISSYTKPLTEEQALRLRATLDAKGLTFASKPYCIYAASRPGLSVAVYEKGPKVVVQGRDTEDFVLNTLEAEVLGVAELGYEHVHHPERYEPHFGVDESGKGDFFGPLVIAGAHVDEAMARKLREIGVMDSKRVSSDARIRDLAGAMLRMRGFVSEVIVIGPPRYNELYSRFKNLNRLLAWGHATVIESLLGKVPGCQRAVSDQFADARVLESALKTKGRAISVQQRTKAEDDPAVAAASILARAGFIDWLTTEGGRLGVQLPKGVSPTVKETARTIMRQHGLEGLVAVSKVHFKTMSEVCGV